VARRARPKERCAADQIAAVIRRMTSLLLSPGPRSERSRSTTALSKPDQSFALLISLVLVAHGPQRERGGDRLKGGLADRDLDHCAAAG
jgi:hypothetical protein